ncbi:alpha/beta fold hydrolase [Thermodesulfobacteriota bacterium]
MPNVTANGIQIEYDTFGEKSGKPILLIVGLGCQLIFWSEEFCQQLANSGHYVIRFDNRDSGLSTKFEEAGVPDLMEAMRQVMRGEKIEAPYTYDDMADDTVGIIDTLGIEKAHICGMSMGGAIAQTIAMRHPSRVLSLIPIYGPTGNPKLPQPKPEILGLLLTPPPEERESFIDHSMNIFRAFAGSGYEFEESWLRDLAGRGYDRAFYPQGMARQFIAGLAHGNRRRRLKTVTAPTLVIQGDEDPIVPVENGREAAEAIPGAELLVINGMGHDIPYRGAWVRIAEAIAEYTRKVVG